jgi:CBS domain-containing protein
MRVRDFMSKDVVTISADADVAAAREMLRLREVEHLVVMDGKRAAGIIARQDIVHAADNEPVTQVMSANVVTITPGETLRRVAGAMVGRAVGCLPVIEKERLVGIVTTSDVLTAVAKGEIHAAPPTDRVILRKRGPRKHGSSVLSRR